MRIASVVGARPQFVKLAAMCNAVRRLGSPDSIDHRIIHTGQHYDRQMSAVFFSELNLPPPDHDLGVGSGSHAIQTGEMMKRLEPLIAAGRPDCVLLYGDTNSTLAGALVCAKLHIPAAHVEAGLRSFNRGMPEEVNRVVADHLCDVLFCPTTAAAANLAREGLAERTVLSGDIMYDAAIQFREAAEARGAAWRGRFGPGEFALATIHRADTTDDADKLRSIAAALETLARDVCPVVFPVHPRTAKCAAAAGIGFRSVTVCPPVPYLEMLYLESHARFIVTDSGGVQKEAYFFRVPCITARAGTEWVETLENGCNVLAGTAAASIVAAAGKVDAAGPWLNHYGNGSSCETILQTLANGSALMRQSSAAR
jgi:UDP-GlcNAc3NAcA epimerase